VLKRLDVPDLAIEGGEDPAPPPDKGHAPIRGRAGTNQYTVPKAQKPAPSVDEGGGYNPYNMSVPAKKPSVPKKTLPPKGSGGRSR
jgi:hypothetical protein